MHLGQGVLIRKDDFVDLEASVFRDLTNLGGEARNTQGGVLSPSSTGLIIRSIWPGQSFVFLAVFRAGSTRRIPPFHMIRFDAVSRKYICSKQKFIILKFWLFDFYKNVNLVSKNVNCLIKMHDCMLVHERPQAIHLNLLNCSNY